MARNPDAALIRTCTQHIANMNAYNACQYPTGDEAEAGPLWREYIKTRDAISAAKPKTVDGMIAIAKAALAESAGEDPSFHGPDGEWAWLTMRALLRLHGQHA